MVVRADVRAGQENRNPSGRVAVCRGAKAHIVQRMRKDGRGTRRDKRVEERG